MSEVISERNRNVVHKSERDALQQILDPGYLRLTKFALSSHLYLF